MKKISVFLSIQLFLTAAIYTQQGIIGTWQYETIYGVSQIAFNEDKTVIIDGESAEYTLQGKYIIINDASGSYSYHYQFVNGKLVLTFPDGSQVAFQRTGQGYNASSSGSNTGTMKAAVNNQAEPSGKSAIDIKNLTGRWEYHSSEGNIALSVISENILVYDGDQVHYSLGNSAFNVSTDYGIVTYPFELSGDNLTIAFPEGYQLTFKRAQQQTASQAAGQKNSSQGGNVSQLYGKLCYYSGSSSTYSSYSRMEYIYFDGKGRFQFWKETSFSSDAGLAYGSDQDPNYVGSYSIIGDVVTMTFDSGLTNTLKVYMRQNSGRITELMYKQKLYATGLCD